MKLSNNSTYAMGEWSKDMRIARNTYRWSVTLFSLMASSFVFAGHTYNMTQGVTPISHAVYNLHMLAFWVCVCIGVVVFGVMFYAIIRHRKSRGVKPAEFHENIKIELVWAAIPFLILIALAIPATKALIIMADESDPDINIMVTASQWKWQYDYLDDGISFISNLSTPDEQIKNKAPKGEHYLLEVDNPLILPINKKIRFIITSSDVIHSWWVPAFGMKRDAVPGYAHEIWAKIEEPGTYRGQCAELCGINHAFMPIVVEAKTEKDYQQWLDSKKATLQDSAKAEAKEALRTWSKDELMTKGEGTYMMYCAACHQANGKGIPPTFPAMKDSPIATGPVDEHIDIVLHGKSGTAMQAFEKQLSDSEIAAVITYERNAWGNDTGDVIQPVDIVKAKGGEVPALDKNVSDAAIDQTDNSEQ